jgi:hypothetical protein
MKRYPIGTVLIAQNNYLDLTIKGEEYVVDSGEDFGEGIIQAMYLSYKGKRITVWPFKEFELDIQFKIK